MQHFPSFSARVVSGSGRGRTIGSPTINLNLQDVPTELDEGIFAVMAVLQGKRLKAALFYGPRPVFNDTPACEVYLLDTVPDVIPDTLTVEVIAYIRDVRDFDTVADLQKQIAIDVEQARDMLIAYDTPSTQETHS
jgi:riboflavin kinase / FMN adenylyltransferase